MIHAFLGSSYWAKGMPRALLEKAIGNSLCFGAYLDGAQVGFGRVITDFATFGYLSDVFVLPEFRGFGVGKAIVKAIVAEPRLQGLRRLLLSTKDAHKLYSKSGFEPLANPSNFMTIHNPDVYHTRKPD